jgi:hypothetical protein
LLAFFGGLHGLGVIDLIDVFWYLTGSFGPTGLYVLA